MAKAYDVAIIGAGTAGLTARAEVSKRTENYVVLDGGILGTTCARAGCMPSKSLIQVANAFHEQLLLKKFEIRDGEIAPLDIRKVMAHVRRLRDRFVGGVEKGMDSWSQHLIRKNARFVDLHTLDLGDEKIRAEKIIIATGSRPVAPAAWKKYAKYLVDTDLFFELPTLPPRMAVFGLGPNGMELGQAMMHLGIDVVAINSDKSIGGLTDPAMQECAFETFSGHMRLRIGEAEILGENAGGLKVGCGKESWTVDQVLLAIGRRPQVAELGLEKIGVELDGRGVPPFDRTTMQIKNLPIFIAGDANGLRPILHEASDEGRIAGYNATADDSSCFQKRVFLEIVFSDPNIAVVGRSHASLVESGDDFVVGESNYARQGRALMMGRNEGKVRLYAGKKDGIILGAELLAPEGEHLAHLIGWAISRGLKAADVLSMPFYHPTLEEGLRAAFRQAVQKSEAPKPGFEMLRCEDAIVE